METTEWEKDYYAGAIRLAMRKNSDTPLYLIGDHLGSTSLVINTSGQEVAKRSYLPFGETWGVSATQLPTNYTYTGQREAAEIGLKYYVARWYDSEIGHFIQADTIVPCMGDIRSWNHYAYVNYNPINYFDPSGHKCEIAENGSLVCSNNFSDNQTNNGYKYDSFIGLTNVAIIMIDALEIVVSLEGVLIELSLLSLSAVDPVPGDEPIALIAAIEAYANTVGVIENGLGWAGFLLGLAQGFHTGENYFDSSTGEFHLGEDSTTDILFAIVGSGINEAFSDFFINIISAGNDIGMLPQAPISFTANSSGTTIFYNEEPIMPYQQNLDYYLPWLSWLKKLEQ